MALAALVPKAFSLFPFELALVGISTRYLDFFYPTLGLEGLFDVCECSLYYPCHTGGAKLGLPGSETGEYEGQYERVPLRMKYLTVAQAERYHPHSHSSGNLVAENHVHRFKTLLGDGGGIYALGPQPKSVMEANWV